MNPALSELQVLRPEWVALFCSGLRFPRKLIGCVLNFAAKFNIAKEAILNVREVEPNTTGHGQRSKAQLRTVSLFDFFMAVFFLLEWPNWLR